MGSIEETRKISDAELVALASKNPDEFAHIMHRYDKPLARYLKHLIKASPEDTDDLLQNIFIKVYTNLNDFDTSLSFSSWIYRIAHNEAIYHIRRIKRRPVHAQTESDDEEEDEFSKIASEIDVAEDVDKLFLKKNVAHILDTLDPKYKSVLVLKYLEDKDYNEISDILKKPVGTVGTLINRAKKQFKEKANALGLRIEHL